MASISMAVTLVHEISAQLHGRRQFLVSGVSWRSIRKELLDGLDPREIGVHRLDLALDQSWISAARHRLGIIGEGDVVVLGELLDILVIDHDKAGQIRPLVADHDGIGDVGREFELVFEFRRRDVLSARGDDESFIRSVILTKPSLSIEPTSPVCSQPLASMVSAVSQAG